MRSKVIFVIIHRIAMFDLDRLIGVGRLSMLVVFVSQLILLGRCHGISLEPCLRLCLFGFSRSPLLHVFVAKINL